jgi:hypothetical protein
MTRGKINDVLADPKFDEIQRGRQLTRDTHGLRHSGINYQPLELMRSDRWLYNKGMAEEENTGLTRINKIASQRPLPEGYKVLVTKEDSQTYTASLHDSTQRVGTVTWNGDTGYVHNLAIPEEKHRPMLSHLLDAAHKVSHENGHTGPVQSDSLSAYSYKLMRKYAPSFIPEDAMVEGEDEHVYEHATYAHQNAVQEARAQWNIAKPHLLNASTNNPLARVRVTEHEKLMRQLETLTKQGRLLSAQGHAEDVGKSNAHLLYRAFSEPHPREVAEALAKSGGHLGKIVGNDFYDELYGH